MSRGEDNIAIEVSSSPEPEIPGKLKQLQPRSAKYYASGSIIELSDGDDDTPPPSINVKSVQSADSGFSTRQSLAQKLPALGASSTSRENIPLEHRKVKAGASKPPLFLPSDEENAPPDESSKPKYPLSSPPSFTHDRIGVSARLSSPVPEPVMLAPPEDNSQNNTEIDARISIMNRVHEIIPDVEPDHLLTLLTKHTSDHTDQTQDVIVEQILHALFEDNKYPRIDRMNKGKRKQLENNAEDAQAADASPQKKAKVDYSDQNRLCTPTRSYSELALSHLQASFPYVPKSYVQSCLNARNGLYAPSHIFLLGEEQRHQKQREAGERVRLPYNKRVKPFIPKGKTTSPVQDPEFEEEHQWLLSELNGKAETNDLATEEASMQDEDCQDGIECGCCFSSCAFDKMVQCPETHLFCVTCMTSYASTLLGSHDPNIRCMDQSGCKELISHSELARFLTPKLMSLYERVKQRKEVEAAGLEDMEECPFCEWGCIIENPEEKLLKCGNTETCGVVSCRICKKLDHLPKSCKEMEESKHLGGQHAVEEAMSQALMRNCPKCQKAFIKESGCNKMTCPHCHTLSCYVCREIIRGYEHFNQSQPGQPGPSNTPSKSKCLLWDSVEHRHADEVKAAAERALAAYKTENPDVEDKDIKIDLPTAPPLPRAQTSHLDQQLQNAEAELQRATADLNHVRADESRQRDSMRGREQRMQLLTSKGKITTAEYQDLMVSLVQAQTVWYQKRVDVQNAEARVVNARTRTQQLRQQIANVRAPPAWNLNLHVNLPPYGMPLPALRMPPRPVANRPRKTKARRR